MKRASLLLIVLLAGCEAEDCPQGSLLDHEGGLVLTAETHPEGWGVADCEACHALASLHTVSCTEGVDLDALRAEVAASGYEGCQGCHGDNGVAP